MTVGNSDPSSVPVHLKFSPSRLSTEDSCPQKAHYTYSRGLDPGSSKPTPALLRGTIIHRYMDLWHGQGIKPVDAFSILKEEFPTYEGQILTPVGLVYMQRYVATHQDDLKRYRVVGAEKRFIIPFTTPHGHEVFLDGIIDLIVEDLLNRNAIEIWDHKTDSRNIWSGDVVSFDRQLNQYAVIAYLLDYDPTRITVNQIKTSLTKIESIGKAPKEELFHRHSAPVTPSSVEAWMRNIGKRIDQILEAEYVHKNLGAHCIFCPYRQACQMELNGVDPEPYLRSNFGKRDDSDLTLILDIEDGVFDA